MSGLAGEVAIVTGAAHGMGAVHARRFIEEGASVVLSDVADDDGRALAEHLGDRAVFVHHDVTAPESWATVVDRAQQEFGAVSVLVNNAGRAGAVAGLLDLELGDYLAVIAVDQHAILYGMRAVAPTMRRAGRGSIVNISSISGMVATGPTPNIGYTAAKFAVRGLTRHAAVELGPCGIRVNCVLPGGVDTPLSRGIRATRSDEENARFLPPVGRMAQPTEMSEAVLFLASARSSFVNGAELVVDGGRLA